MVLFLIASGLSLIFGVTRVVNFAHGSFYMLAAYLAYTLAPALPLGAASFYVAVALAALAVGALGTLVEVGLLRRVYRAHRALQLLLTFALVLVVLRRSSSWSGAARTRRGRARPGSPAPSASRAARAHVRSRAHRARAHRGRGALVLFYRTRWGVLIRAATLDREMVALLGVDQARLFTGVFRAWLRAGRPGRRPADSTTGAHHRHGRGHHHGGLRGGRGGRHGLRAGALLAAIVIGVIDAFGVLVLPRASLVLTFVVMAVVLVVRPWGLLGRPEAQARSAGGRHRARGVVAVPAGSSPPSSRLGGAAATAAHVLRLGARRDLAFALFAASLHLLMGRAAWSRRPRGRLRPRRLWCGAARAVGEGADARAFAAARWRPPWPPSSSASSACGSVDLLRDAHAGRSPDRLRDRAPVVRRDGGDTASSASGPRLARLRRSATTIWRSPPAVPGLGALAARRTARRSASRCGRRATTRGARGGRDRRARAPVAGLRRRGVLRGLPAAPSRSSRASVFPELAGGAGLGGAARDGAAGRRAFPPGAPLGAALYKLLDTW